jgi:hypothetical protein
MEMVLTGDKISAQEAEKAGVSIIYYYLSSAIGGKRKVSG